MARSARRFAAISTSVIVAAVLLVGAPGPTRATASVLWVAQSGTAVVPGTSCTSPGYVGTTDVAIQAAIKETIAAHGLKMPQLAIPVRVLVCGRAQTPSVDAVLELFDKEIVIKRLRSI